MEPWQTVWRKGLAPLLSIKMLETLETALKDGSPELIQETTAEPKIGDYKWYSDCEPQGACLIGYCGWKGDGLKTVGEIENYFNNMCRVINHNLPFGHGVEYLIRWFDESPIEVISLDLIGEIELELERRGVYQCPTPIIVQHKEA